MANWALDDQTIHLNHGSFGATPIEVLEHQTDLRSQLESNPVDFMLRRYQPLLEAGRLALSAFVHADPAGVVFVPNATYGVNSVLRSLEPQIAPGAEIVVTSHTYNACHNAAIESAKRCGASVAVAAIPFPATGPDVIVAAVAAAITPSTRVLLIDHVTSATALVLPLLDIVRALPEHITVLVDGAHAPGMIDVDLGALADAGVDFYTANCHKWVCAPKGSAFLWVAPQHRAWTRAAAISHGYNDGWPESASAFHAQFDWTGTDDPTARLCVATALDVMANHCPGGWDELRESNHRLVLQGRDVVANALGSPTTVPTSMVGSMVALPAPTGLTADWLHREWSIELPVFRWDPLNIDLFRVSAQQYNTLDDYAALADALDAWRSR